MRAEPTSTGASKRLVFSGDPGGDPDPSDNSDPSESSDDDDSYSDISNDFSNPIKKVIEAMNINALEKEVVNVKFITQSLEESFTALTKIQKSKLKALCTLIVKQMVEITQYYPEGTKIYDQVFHVFEMLGESIILIEDRLKQSGEGEINFQGAGRINSRLLSLHQPQQYVNYRNVNDNFLANLARRNN